MLFGEFRGIVVFNIPISVSNVESSDGSRKVLDGTITDILFRWLVSSEYGDIFFRACTCSPWVS